MKKTIVLLIAGFFLFGTQSYAQVKVVTYRETNAPSNDPMSGVIVTPVLADLKVISEKMIYTEEFDVVLNSTNIDANVMNFKSLALLNALKKSGADLMVGPLYEVSSTPQGLKITVSGWPAVYTNFRSATENDQWMVPILQVSSQIQLLPEQGLPKATTIHSILPYLKK